ncbi:hypothetical protein OIU34_22050 [Pararhizobium sp. BT-229]|uniref:hypothetical protein n=1 Tax=Pararhizobium sp. BT-229 TaxID=2986923 RepID=UPI0021F6D3DC|nr:hypothetical protein [Pararhizobium sp. BT-229]MCV9964576.1 hypothetical protein [Pararhizobium sp. BT-229]
MTENEFNHAKSYIRAALTTTRLLAGREIVFREDGITVSDPFNGKHHFAAIEPPPSSEILERGICQSTFHSYFGSHRPSEMKMSGHGAWDISEKDGTFKLKPARNRNAALESVTAANADDLAMLRSLYDIADVDIVVACEGEARTREIALAFASELNLSGHATELHLEPEHQYVWSLGRNEDADDQDGPVMFSVPEKVGQKWVVQMASKETPPLPPTPGVSRITIWEDEHKASQYGRVTAGAFAPSRRPAVLVGVTLKDSNPVATIVLSTAAKSVASIGKKSENAPWTLYNERKAKRLKSRPPVAKTWHQTTDQVARAFVAREAPRGYVSGKSLYFHGPVAFSVYDRNPVAALVDLPNGKTIMFTGRQAGIGGTLAGTVSGATGDIGTATKDSGFIEFHVGELTDFLTLGDLQLDDMASRFRHKKNEGDYPNTCAVDPARLEQYILSRKKAADEELAHLTRKTSVATYTKASCWAALERIATFRDAMVAHLGIELPDMGDALEFGAKREAESKAARQRQDNLRAGRAALEAEEAERRAEEEERGLFLERQEREAQRRRR